MNSNMPEKHGNQRKKSKSSKDKEEKSYVLDGEPSFDQLLEADFDEIDRKYGYVRKGNDVFKKES